MKSTITFCILVLLFTACRHVEPARHGDIEPEKRSSEVEIRQHIVGEWRAVEGSNGYWYPKLIIAEDGMLYGAQASGAKELIGTWEMSHHLLRVTPSAARIQSARASGVHLNEWDYFPVIYADAHELVMTPGISVAGRWRYKR